MARRRFAPNPNPLADRRSMLCEPEPIRFRRKNVEPTDGRGNGWQKGQLHGIEDGEHRIVWARDCGGWRTLSPDLWEFKS